MMLIGSAAATAAATDKHSGQEQRLPFRLDKDFSRGKFGSQ